MSRYKFITYGEGSHRLYSFEGLGVECKRVDAGMERFEYLVEYDEDRMQRMAVQAARNKQGISYDGPLKVSIIKREVKP